MVPLSPFEATTPNGKGVALRSRLGGYPPSCHNKFEGFNRHLGRINASAWRSTQIQNKALPKLTFLMLNDMQTQFITIKYKDLGSRAVKMKAMGTKQSRRKKHHSRDMA